jgi:hypothetical protein
VSTRDELPAALRGYLARILGWSAEQAVESALRSIALSITYRVALVLLGDADLVSIAQALHRRTVGADRPFVVCDPRRPVQRASVRTPASHESGVGAVRAALGGSLCLRRRRLPRDLRPMAILLRGPDAPVQLIVCAEASHDVDPFLLRPAPILVPPLGARAAELPRIIDEYACDAISALGADDAGFAEGDRTWVLDHAAARLADIETATLRRVALRMSRTVAEAARRLGMSHVSLHQWIGRRRLDGRGTVQP